MKTVFRFLLGGFVAFVSVRAAEPAKPADTNNPVVISAGADWVPLKAELDIEPGSALDFSGIGGTDAPAGKHGWVIARPDGQFAFTDSPKISRRFYGANFCFSSLYLSHEQSDRIAARLARLGYNAFRIHHYERELTQGQANSTSLNPQKIEQLDYLVAALIRRGIYLTTDLFVSRGIRYRDIGVERDGEIPMDTYKILVPVHPGAFENWKQFSRALLAHTNTYTQRRYADEPALAWIAMINEGNFGNFFKDIQTIPEWKTAWNHWLQKQYANRSALAEAWGAELKPSEDPAGMSVGFPDRLQASGPRARDCIIFLADTDREMVQRMKRFLHDELGCRALVSNSSSWTRFTTDQFARQIYDYVDDHFYVDHPRFLEAPWRLPSRSPNANPISEGAPGGRSIAFTRLFDKPFTVTEYNYSGPGRFRGVGGILTGALGALQGWGGIWRFAYSHNRESMFNPSHMEYFNLDSDPLAQASDRASLCLFLRGDLQPAPHSVGLVMTEADLKEPAAKIPTLAPDWHWAAWVTRIGTQVVPSSKQRLPQTAIVPLGWHTPATEFSGDGAHVLPVTPYSVSSDRLVSALEPLKLFTHDNAPRPAEKFFQSETGEITIDGPRGQLVLDTPRTAGGYGLAGQSINASRAGVRIAVEGNDATVWVSALDGQPISRSGRLLVTHLTDLQNSQIRYAEPARQTLLDWGHLPYLVHSGKAVVTIHLSSPRRFHVWALALTGKRLAELPSHTQSESLTFTADVAADSTVGARLLYEVTAEGQ